MIKSDDENKLSKVAHVAAREWSDGFNIYHSVCVIMRDGTQLIEPFHIGYGKSVFSSVGRLIGLSDPASAEYWRTWGENVEVMRHVDVCSVHRRKDLHLQGRQRE